MVGEITVGSDQPTSLEPRSSAMTKTRCGCVFGAAPSPTPAAAPTPPTPPPLLLAAVAASGLLAAAAAATTAATLTGAHIPPGGLRLQQPPRAQPSPRLFTLPCAALLPCLPAVE